MTDAKELLNSKEYQGILKKITEVSFLNKDVYGCWLAQTSHFAAHSVRLSSLGASVLDSDDPLQKRMISQVSEEMGHHTIAKKDIKALGRSIDDYPEFGLTKSFYQSQYYKVLFEHPAHLLGQILMLEALSADKGDWLYGLIEPAYGEAACKFVKVHALEDQTHVQHALAACNRMEASRKAGVYSNFLQACDVYSAMLDRVETYGVQRERQLSATA